MIDARQIFDRKYNATQMTYGAAGMRPQTKGMYADPVEEEEKRKAEEAARLREDKPGADMDEFFVKYARARRAEGTRGVVKNAEALRDTKDRHILSNPKTGEVENKEVAETQAGIGGSIDPGLVDIPDINDYLNREQIEDLLSRYDPDNLDPFRLKELAGELRDLGLLTDEEYEWIGFVPTPGVNAGFLQELDEHGKVKKTYVNVDGKTYDERHREFRMHMSYMELAGLGRTGSAQSTLEHLSNRVENNQAISALLGNDPRFTEYTAKLQDSTRSNLKLGGIVARLQQAAAAKVRPD